MQLRLSHKLSIIIFLIAFMPLAATTAVTYHFAKQIGADRISNRIYGEIQLVAGSIETTHRQMTAQFDLLTEVIARDLMDSNVIPADLSKAVLAMPDFRCIRLLHPSEGVAWEAGACGPLSATQVQPATIEPAKTSISKIVFVNGEPLRLFSRLLYSKENAAYQLIAFASYKKPWRIIMAQEKDTGAIGWIFTNDRQLIHPPPDTLPGEQNPWANSAILEETLNHRISYDVSGFVEGRRSLVFAVPLIDFGGALILELPYDEVFRWLGRFSNNLILSLCFIIFASYLGGYHLTKKVFTEPLQKIMDVVQKIGKGDLSERMEIRGNDEFADLAKVINDTQDDLAVIKHRIEIDERINFLGRIAVGLAHDLKHPVATIKTATSLLKMKRNDPTFLDRYNKIIDEELQTVSHFLDNLHQLGSSEELRREPVQLERFLDELAAKLISSSTDKPLRYNVQAKKGIILFTDAFTLERVLTNLIVNAVQAMSADGLLTLTAEKEGKSVVITVTDTGVGIDRSRLNTLFDDFHSTKRNGLGLGLAITKKYIGQMGGSISVSSVPGEGTAFTLLFPL